MEDTSFKKSEYGSVMSLAQRYVGLIQNIQPCGPFYLGKYTVSNKFYVKYTNKMLKSTSIYDGMCVYYNILQVSLELIKLLEISKTVLLHA